jgi:hypothetical protein
MSGLGVVLVGCAASKLREPAAARDLYTSQLFRSARAWGELNGRTWYVLSAEHGLLAPGMVVAPYDRRITDLGPEERFMWALRVVGQLQAVEHGDVWMESITVLAGASYVRPLTVATGSCFVQPLRGLGVGERLAWFKRELAA